MDAYEATRIVFSRIQSIDPENASKIMGLLLIQDHGDKEMIRLAFGPEALLQSVVLKARKDLGLSPTTPSTPCSPSPFFSRQNSSSSRLLLSNLSPSSSPWAPPSTYSDVQNLEDFISPNNLTIPTASNTSSASYAAVVAAMNGFNNPTSTNNMLVGSSPTPPSDLIMDELQLQDQLSFLDAAASTKGSDFYYPQPSDLGASPNNNTDAMLFPPYWGGAAAAAMNNENHRRSFSATDMCLGSSDLLGSSLGWKPCLYFARGYCKNGSSCRFLHGLPDSPDSNSIVVGSPNKLDVMEQCQELLLLRSKAQQQQQLRSQLIMASSTFPYSPTSVNSKCMNFLLQQNDTHRAALMLGEDTHKFSSRNRIERSDYLNPLGGMVVNPGSRQIYLTFPADSTFREEDVSNYFSIYGPVQDVRIPYQQKRMFGFVTFVYPETVKLILAKGNPHFVCDARVLVKPYKEKGKVPDKKQQQQMERGEFSACTTPTGLDSRDPFELQLGGRMLNTTQDMLRRKLEEQVELQQAIELQSRRFMGLQLLDVKKQHYHQRNLSSPSPTHPFSSHFNHTAIHPSSSSDRSSPESNQDNCMSPSMGANQAEKVHTEKEESNQASNDDDNGKDSPKHDESDSHNGLEHNLPDSPFASPTKFGSSGEAPSFFSTTMTASAAPSINNNSLITASSLLPATSLDMASFKSCFFQIPRFSSDHGAIGM